MTILHSNGIAFASIASIADKVPDNMLVYSYTQFQCGTNKPVVWHIACYSRLDFLELLNYWNRASQGWKYFE